MPRKKKSRARPRFRGKNPTPKQSAFFHHYTNLESDGFGNATRACERAGYKGAPGSNQLAVQGVRNLRNSNLQEAVRAALEKQGFTPTFIAGLLMDAMRATKPQVLPTRKGKRAVLKLPNHPARMQGFDRAWHICAERAAGAQGGVPPSRDVSEQPENQKLEAEPISEYSAGERLLMHSASDKIMAALRLIGEDESLTAELLRLAQQKQVAPDGESNNNS